MFVVKRDGRREKVSFDKITARINKLAWGLNPLCDPVSCGTGERLFVAPYVSDQD